VTRARLAMCAALAAIGILLWLPAPKRPVAAVPDRTAASPGAKPFPIPATFPDGSAYTPGAVLDPGTSIGVTQRADGQHIDLDLVPATGPPRLLQTQLVSEGGAFDGIAFTADDLYWMHTLSDGTGNAHVTLWTAARSGGPSRQLSADVGDAEFFGSGYDVQVVADRLYWAATRPGRQDQTELRSIPLAGGTVGVQVLDGAWAMSRWPWLVTAPSAASAGTRLRNAVTGQVVPVNAPPNKLLTCSPTWCRMIPDNAAQPAQTDLIRPDGSDRRVIADASTAATGGDVAVLDRFELLMTVIDPTSQVVVSRLSLYDIARRRTVLISPASTDSGIRGTYLWWSTGNNETLQWYGLDLRTLD